MAYAAYGIGKTFLMGTAADVPAMRDVLMISAESGDMTLSDDPDHNFDLIDYVRVKDYKTVARVYDFLKLHCTLRDSPDPVAKEKLLQLQERFLPGSGSRIRQYRTVIVDSLTEVEQYCMMQLLGIGDATKLDDEVAGAEWKEYKVQHTMVQRLVRSFRDLPMHVLFTAARAYREDELKRSLYSPQMTGKLAGQVQGFMDMVGYLVMGNAPDEESIAPRRMYIQPSPRYDAKSRFSRYRRPYFDNPTIGGILHAVGMLGDEDVPPQYRLTQGASKPKAR